MRIRYWLCWLSALAYMHLCEGFRTARGQVRLRTDRPALFDMWSQVSRGVQSAIKESPSTSTTIGIGATSAAAAVSVRALKRALWRPSRAYNGIQNSVGREYDAWTKEGILEDYWGEHIHLGYYSKAERDSGYLKKDFVQAKLDFIDQMVRFGKLSSLEDGARVLDVGCGIGGTSRYIASKFAEQGRDVHVTGITLSQLQATRAAVLALKKGLENSTSFRVMDALQMTFPDDSFDVVWACESGEHMPDKKKYVDEMIRVLKPGGTLVIATWCQRDDTYVPFSSKERKMLEFLYSEWTHPFFISIKDYVDLLSSNELTENIRSADWTEDTVPSWRHSIMVGVFNPWPVIKRPWLWWKCVRDGVTLERMRSAFSSGLMQYGMVAATKI